MILTQGSTLNGSLVMKGGWLKHREQVKPSPIKKEVCAEFNDTSHKTTLNGSKVMKAGVAKA